MSSTPKSLDRCLVFLILAIGVLARIGSLLYPRSLNADEAALALNVLQRNFIQIFQNTQSLEMAAYIKLQVAPLGYLILLKSSTVLLGSSEFVLKLWAFIFGIAGLFLFVRIAHRILGRTGAYFAAFLFATTDILIHFSGQVKPYTLDVLLAMVVLWFFLKMEEDAFDLKAIISFALVGIIAVWSSIPGIIVLTSTGLSLAVHFLFKKQNHKAVVLLVLVSIWLINFYVYYQTVLHFYTDDSVLHAYWKHFYFYGNISNLEGVKSAALGFFSFIDFFVVDKFTFLPKVLFLWGCISLCINKRYVFLIFLAPIVLAHLFSLAGKYPYVARLYLFLAPMTLIVIGAGLELIIECLRLKKSISKALIIIVCLIGPVTQSITYAKNPYTEDNIKPILAFLSEHKQPGDTVYVYYGAKTQFHYYASQYGLDSLNVYYGKNTRRDGRLYAQEISRFLGKQRVWFVFSHIFREEDRRFLKTLNDHGPKLHQVYSNGASGYLYRLR